MTDIWNNVVPRFPKLDPFTEGHSGNLIRVSLTKTDIIIINIVNQYDGMLDYLHSTQNPHPVILI